MAEVDLNVMCIYKIINLINNNVYLGSAVNLRKRKDLHLFELRANKHHSRYLQNAWNKYGEQNFKFEIIEIIQVRTKLIEREQYWIDLYSPEYNICLVAESRLGVKSSPEHVAKIIAANTGQKRSKETCIKIGLSKKGTKLSEERKQARRDYRHTEENKKKISEAGLGRKHSEISKMEMSQKAKQRIRKPLSEETKAKLRIAALAQWNNKPQFTIITCQV